MNRPKCEPGAIPLRRFRNNSWQRECVSIAYNGSFGGEAEKPQCGRRNGEFG